MDHNGENRNASLTLWLAVVFLLAGLALQLSYALKFSDRPVLLMAGSVLSFVALLLILRHNRQRKPR